VRPGVTALEGFAARADRFGQRPLYFASRGDGVVVAGSLWQIVGDPGCDVAWDGAAAALSLQQSLPAGRTLWKGISRVPPGAALEVTAGRPRVTLREPEAARRDEVCDPSQADRQLLRLLRGAVQAAAEGDPGCALSGGLDSAGLLALAAESGRPLRAFGLVDDACSREELSAARELVARFGAEHVLVRVVEEELPDLAEGAVRACEEPLWNGRAVSRWQFFRGVRSAGCEALLSGTGADELLCGHPAGLRALSKRRDRERALAATLVSGDASAPAPDDVGSALCERRRLVVERVLPESTLPPETRGSRAVGVDVRLPYLEEGFAAWALRLPPELLVDGDTGKLPLRHALRGLLPGSLCDAPKRPALSAPGGRQMRATRGWRELYAGWLTKERLAATGPFDAAAVAGALAAWDRAPGERDVEDAVLLRLVSLAMLARTTGSVTGARSAPPRRARLDPSRGR